MDGDHTGTDVADAPTGPRRGGFGRLAARALLALLALPLIVYALLPPLSSTDAARALVARFAEAEGYALRVDSMHIGYDLSLVAAGVTLAEGDRPQFLAVRELTAGPDFGHLPGVQLGVVRAQGLGFFPDNLPSGSGGAGMSLAWFHGLAVRDAVMHVETGRGGRLVLGPSAFNVDSIRGGEELQIHGRFAAAGDSASAHWTLRLNPRDLGVRGEFECNIEKLGAAAEQLLGVELPAAVAGGSSELSAELSGSLRGSTDLRVEGRSRFVGSRAPLMYSAEGRFEFSSGSASVELAIEPGEDLPELRVSGSVVGLGAAAPAEYRIAADWPQLSLSGLAESHPGLFETAAVKDGALVLQLDLSGPLRALGGRGAIDLHGLSTRVSQWELAADLKVPFHLVGGIPSVAEWDPARVSFSALSADAGLEIDDATVAAELPPYQDSWAGTKVSMETSSLRLRGAGFTATATTLADLRAQPGAAGATVWLLRAHTASGLLRRSDAAASQGLDLKQYQLSIEGRVEAGGDGLGAPQLRFALGGIGSGELSVVDEAGGQDAGLAASFSVPEVALVVDRLAALGMPSLRDYLGGALLEGRLDGTLRVATAASAEDAGVPVAGWLYLKGGSVVGQSWSAAADVEVPFELGSGSLALAASGLRLRNFSGTFDDLEWNASESTVVGSLGWQTDGFEVFTGGLTLKGVSAHDSEFIRAVEDLELTLAGSLRIEREGPWRFSFNASSGRGEVLWGSIYSDLAAHGVGAVGEGELGRDGRLYLSDLTVSAVDFGSLGVAGKAAPASGVYDLSVDLDVPRSGALFSTFVVQPLAPIYPMLEGATAEGGVNAELRLLRDRSGAGVVRGTLRLEGLGARSASGDAQLRGVDAEIPLILSSAGEAGAVDTDAVQAGIAAAEPAKARERAREAPPENAPEAANAEAAASAVAHTGRIKVGGLEFAGLASGGFEVGLRSAANRLSTTAPFELSFLGGKLTVDGLDLSREQGEGPSLELALRLSGLSLQRVAESYGWPEIEGSVSGALDKIRVDGRSLVSQGGVTAELFGGRITAHDPGVDALFSRVPTLHSDVDFEDIDLGIATGTVKVGHISGILRGKIEHLSIAAGQPVAFDAKVETVAKPGVPQRVSFDAIRQISILGGSGHDPLVSGLLQFFGDYRYAKMGFQCSLRNDRFHLTGIARDDGKDFLVVGAWMPPRVNVVSHNQDISFSKMLDRLETAMGIWQDSGSEGSEQ